MPPALKMGDAAGGVILAGANTTVFVESKLWAVVGCPVIPHGKPPCAPAPSMVMTAGPHTVFVQGVPGLHLADQSSCGCPGAPGAPTVKANG
ncbi:MAG TPA: hypothetical protein ENK18_05565 [Deltaproteobacteria bacterium]|nr:hypothetical protein [Deltaproteobacteria bacterium]